MPTITFTTRGGTGSQSIAAGITDLVVAAHGPGRNGTAGTPYVEDDPEVPGNQGQAPTAGSDGLGGAFGRKNFGTTSATTLYYGLESNGVAWFNLGTNSSLAANGAYRVGGGTSVTPASGQAFTQTYTTTGTGGAGSGGNGVGSTPGTPDGGAYPGGAPNGGGSAGFGGGSGFPINANGDPGTDPGLGGPGQIKITFTDPTTNLTSTSVATSAPSVATSTVGQKHALGATGMATSAPSIQTSTFNQTRVLTSTNVATAAPAAATPNIGQAHALTSTAVATSAPAAATSTVAQRHALSATAVATSAPAIATPAAVIGINLAATGLATSAPALGPPAIAQRHALSSSAAATAAPAIQTATIAQRQVLTALSLATAAPAIASPTFTQKQALSATSVATAAPAMAAPSVGQAHALVAGGGLGPERVTNGSLADGTGWHPGLPGMVFQNGRAEATGGGELLRQYGVLVPGKTYRFEFDIFMTGGSHVRLNFRGEIYYDSSVSGTEVALGAGLNHYDLTFTVPDAPSGSDILSIQASNSFFSGWIDNVSVREIGAGGLVSTASPQIQTAALVQVVVLTPQTVATAAPAIQSATVTQRHALTSTSVATAAPSIPSPTFTQRQALVAVGVGTPAADLPPPSLSTPNIGQVHNILSAPVATSAPAIALGGLGVILSVLALARPDRTSSAGGWTTDIGGLDLHTAVDEAVADDNDFIKSGPDPVDDVARLHIGLDATAVYGTMKLRYRTRRSGAIATASQTFRLYQGGGDVPGAGTLIGGPWIHNVTAPQTFEQEIAASLVTDPRELYVEVEAG